MSYSPLLLLSTKIHHYTIVPHHNSHNRLTDASVYLANIADMSDFSYNLDPESNTNRGN
jgi:hypothetical protein